MSARAAPGAWVRIHAVVLCPAERAAHLPEETRAVPLEMTAKGFLRADAAVGDEVEIETPAGRRLRGTLAAVAPPTSTASARRCPSSSRSAASCARCSRPGGHRDEP